MPNAIRQIDQDIPASRQGRLRGRLRHVTAKSHARVDRARSFSICRFTAATVPDKDWQSVLDILEARGATLPSESAAVDGARQAFELFADVAALLRTEPALA
jgi:heme oxygenase